MLSLALLVSVLMQAPSAKADPLPDRLRPAGVAERSPGSEPVSAPRASKPGKVLLITAPRLTWDKLNELRPANLMKLLGHSAVASMSVRTVGSDTTPGEAYLTLGAGNRAPSDPEVDGYQVDVGEPTWLGDAAGTYRARMGVKPEGTIVSLGFARLQRLAASGNFGTRPGAMATALAGKGHRVAVVGDADSRLRGVDGRQVALFAVDRTGQVARGTVSADLLVSDPGVPFGLRYDTGSVLKAVDLAKAGSDVVIVELSDLERAELARVDATSRMGDRAFAEALSRSDTLVGELVTRYSGPDDLIMLVGPTSPVDTEQLTVFAASGRGFRTGLARSSTTRRDGFVTLTDVAPTVLAHFGVPAPDSMPDTRIFQGEGESGPGSGGVAGLSRRIHDMVNDNDRAVFRNIVNGPVTVVFIILLVVTIILAVLRLRGVQSLDRVVRMLAFAVLTMPTVAFLSGLVPYRWFTPAGFVVSVIAVSILVGAVVLLTCGSREVLGAYLLVLALFGVLSADIVTGGRLQLSTVFGYSPTVAGRFAGFGNQAFALFSITALLLPTATVELLRRSRSARVRSLVTDESGGQRIHWSVLAGAALFWGLSVVLDGHPRFGSDVGGVLASVPAFTVAGLALTGRRIRIRQMAGLMVGAIVTVGLFALIDLRQPPESRTHLGRFVQSIADGKALTILQRKLDSNLSVLGSSIWTLFVPAALAYFAFLAWRPNQRLLWLRRQFPSFGAFGIGALVLGGLGMALNDSGVSVPGQMMTVAIAYTTCLALASGGHPGAEASQPNTPPGTSP